MARDVAPTRSIDGLGEPLTTDQQRDTTSGRTTSRSATLPGSSMALPVDPGIGVGAFARKTAPPPAWMVAIPIGLAIALIPAYLTSVLLVGVAGVAVLMARPLWALYALAFTVPYQGLADFRYQNVNVTPTEAVFLLLVVGWGTARAAGRVPSPSLTPLVIAIGLLLSLLVLSCVVAPNLVLAGKELVKWVEVAGVTLIGQSLLVRIADRRMMFLVMTAAVVSQAVYGLLQATLHWGPDHFMIGTWLMRAYGSFEQPNPYAGYLGLHLPLVLSVALFGVRTRPARWFWGGASAVLAVALVTTMSRGAWLGQITGILTVVLIESRSARHAVLTFGGLGSVILLALWPVLPSEVTDRIGSIFGSFFSVFSMASMTLTPENWAVMERLSQWYAGWQMFSANPIVGVGIGNYNTAYDTYRLPQWPVALGHAHSHYLTIAAEAGLFACIAYIIVILVAVRSTRTAWRTATTSYGRAIALGTLGSIGALATHNLVDVLFVHGMSVTVGLLLALSSVSDERDQVPSGLISRIMN